MNIEYFLIMLEINNEVRELRASGLTEDEIEGYIDFFMNNWLDSDNGMPILRAANNVKH